MRQVYMIAAIDQESGLAKAGKLPWDLPTDRAYFRACIKDKTVLMGWNTFAANRFEPFEARRNIVVTNEMMDLTGVETIPNTNEFLRSNKEEVWVIGGGATYRACLPYADILYLTRVQGRYGCDVFFPEFEGGYRLQKREPEQSENGTSFHFEIWQANPK